MVDTSYHVTPGAGDGFDVHMTKPGGQVKTATGFGSEHEAQAWIIQTKRMMRDAAPWIPLVPRKRLVTTASRGAIGNELPDRSIAKPQPPD
jgi:hypothetical protein